MDDLRVEEWRCGKSSRFLLGPELGQTWCQDEVFRPFEPAPATQHGTRSPLERPLSLVAPWVPGILCLGESIHEEAGSHIL